MSPNNDLDDDHRLPSGRTFLKQAPAPVPAATGAAVALPPPAPAPAGDNVLAALWRERQDAYNAPKDENSELEDDPNWRRYIAADAAIRAARPTGPAGLAIQVRVLEDSLKEGDCFKADIELAGAIAEKLEALAGRAVA